jgi:hypothetical protein
VDFAALKQALATAGWQDQFDPRSLARGVDYVGQGRVLALEHQARESGDRLTARIRGHGGHLYKVTVTIEGPADDFDWDCACTCPVGFDCKHAVAELTFASRFPPEAWPSFSALPTGRPRTASGASQLFSLPEAIAQLEAGGAALAGSRKRRPAPRRRRPG